MEWLTILKIHFFPTLYKSSVIPKTFPSPLYFLKNMYHKLIFTVNHKHFLDFFAKYIILICITAVYEVEENSIISMLYMNGI